MKPEVLIVGAGVIGLSLAYELSRTGIRCLVVDRQEPGREASWAGAGILPPARLDTALHPVEQLRGLSFDLHAQWSQQLQQLTGIDNGYRRCGGLYLARTAGEAASLLALRQELEEWKITADPWTPMELAEREPALVTLARDPQLRSVLHLPEESQLRNPRHLKALLAACRAQHVEVRSQVEVQQWRLSGQRIQGVETSAGVIQADRYCVTSGAWSYPLLQQLGCAIEVFPVRGQMILFRCPEPPFQRVLNEGPRYLVPRDDGRVLAGSTEEEVGYDRRTTEEGLASLQQFAFGLVPALAAAAIERSWAGLRPGTLDGIPYIGAVPGWDNLCVAAGHYRSGLFLSTGTAVALAAILRGEAPPISLAPFSLLRG